jgi:hypothetical protein
MTAAPLRSLAATAVAALLATGLAACGSNNDSSSGSPATSGATTSATAPSTAGTSDTSGMSTDTTSAATTGSSVAAGSALTGTQMQQILRNAVGAITTAHMTMDMDMSAAGQQVQVKAQGDVQYSPLAETITMDMGSVHMQMLMVDGSIYMKSAAIPSGGKWVKISAKDLGALGSSFSGAMSDPLSMLDKMGPYITKATYVGSDTVGGGSADHYRMTVDLAGMMKKLGMPTSSAVQIPKTADEDLWVDAQGRVVKTTVDLGSLERMTLLMSDFGKPVHIAAPPAGQVKDMSSMGSMGGAGTLGG